MKKRMKQWMAYLVLFALLLTMLPVQSLAAASLTDPTSSEGEVYVGEEGENLFLHKTVTASQYETGTSFVAANTVDGDYTSRWSTNKDNTDVSLIIHLEKLTLLKTIKIFWEREELNINAYKIYASKDGQAFEEVYVQQEKNPKSVHQIDFADGIKARDIKLVVTDFDGGAIKWKNVGINEIEGYSQLLTASKEEISSLREIDEVLVNEEKTQVLLPKVKNGTLEILSSNKDQLVDTKGKVYEPLTDQTAKLTLALTKDGKKETKEVTALVKGKYEDEGVNPCPNVIPSLQEWHGLEGTTVITDNTAVVSDEAFNKVRDSYIKDAGLKDSPSDSGSRVELREVANKGYGKEGYFIKIDNNTIHVEAETATGAMYATKTLLQIGRQVPNGEIRDYPKYPLRGFMIDAARKFVPYRTLMDMLDNMAYYKMNDLHIHLNDNFIWMYDHGNDKDEVLEKAESAFRLESDIVGENGKRLTSDDHYTKEEFKALKSRAEDLGVTIVPEFDVPAHSMAFIKVRPDLMYQGSVGNHKDVERTAMFDLTNPASLEFIKSVFNEQMDGAGANFEGLKTIDFGADEYYGSNEEYRQFVKNMIEFLRDEKGVTPRLWGSLDNKGGTTPIDGRGVQMNIWSLGWNGPQSAINMGFDIINITDNPTYIVPNGSYNRGSYGDFLNLRQVYNWSPNKFGSNYIDESTPNLLGGSFAMWNDTIDLRDTGVTSYDMFIRFFDALPFVAEKCWNADRNQDSYDAFSQRLQELGDRSLAAETNPFYRHSFDVLNIGEAYRKEKVEDKVDHYSFEGEGKLVSDLNDLGPDYHIRLKLSLDDTEGEQVLFTNGDTTFYLRDKEGYLGYHFERYDIRYDKKLEKGRVYTIKINGSRQDTRVYVDGVEIPMLKNEKRPKIAYNSLVMPLKEIGTKGRFDLYQLEVVNGPYQDPNLLQPKSYRANSEETAKQTDKEGPIKFAFDGDRTTIWHSDWNGGSYPFTVDMELEKEEKLGSFTYVPRQSQINGIAKHYKLYLSQDGQDYEMVKEGSWEANNQDKIVDLEGRPAKFIRFEITDAASTGSNHFASAAEIEIRKADEEVDVREKLKLGALEAKLEEARAVEKDRYLNYEQLEKAIQEAEGKVDFFENALNTEENQQAVQQLVTHLDEGLKALKEKPKAPLEGWQLIDGNKRYYVEGKAVTGLKTLGKTTYLFDKEGNAQYEWHVVGGKALYFDPTSGGMVTGLHQVGKTVYLFDSVKSKTAGAKLTGWHRLNGHDYYFDPRNGGMWTGKRLVGKTCYLFNSLNAKTLPGAKLDGWHRLSGYDYYFDPARGGGMVTGWQRIGKTDYLFDGMEGKRPGARLKTGK